MKSLLIAAAAAALASGTAYAQMAPEAAPMTWDAQSFWHGAPDGPRERIQFLQERVNNGLADHSLSPGEAERANGELSRLRQWIHRMHWEDVGQLTPDQSARVQGRLDQISQQIHWMRHSW